MMILQQDHSSYNVSPLVYAHVGLRKGSVIFRTKYRVERPMRYALDVDIETVTISHNI